jgi:cell wall assembly regulator SMI1
MLWNSWTQRCKAVTRACKQLDIDCREFIISPPASEREVEIVEAKLGRTIPVSFRSVLTGYSSHLELRWFLKRNPKPRKFGDFFQTLHKHEEKLQEWINPPEQFKGIFSGDCYWNLDNLINLEKERQGWVENCFPNIEDPYDSIWHNKLAFLPVGNGDMLAIDLIDQEGQVVYLSHEGDNFHGAVLGKNFADFIDRWSLLGFVGAEDWQLKYFIHSGMKGLDPNGENAKAWREWFSLHFETKE